MFLGIEIGGTKLQLGVGPDDGKLRGLWRATVDVATGPEGIRRQIVTAVPELLAKAGIQHSDLRGVGIGFGGPVDDTTRTVIKSHQIEGWDNFPLADWISDVVGMSAVLGNDADVAGLAEALHGAGKGLSPIFYITIGSGIGGGFIIDGEIYRGCGRGAAEFGHLQLLVSDDDRDINETSYAPLEAVASGWAIEQRARQFARRNAGHDLLFVRLAGGQADQVTTRHLGEAGIQGDLLARHLLEWPCVYLADAICHVIALLCPRRIIIGGGVSLMGEDFLFQPLRRLVAERVFKAFSGLTDIVPAALGEEVVVHGAIALVHKSIG
ncbi:MAG TPA: ROK family protein [Gemmataceae bacterium]|jgi:glucokinase